MHLVSRFVVIAILLTVCTRVAAFEETSYRLRSMGAELSALVDDPYTDVLYNPARLNQNTPHWLITNFSNLSGDNHRFFNYGANSYSGSSGAYLAGAFFPWQNFNLGLLLDYWHNTAWQTGGYRMNTSLSSYPFTWNSTTALEGEWITDYNQNDNDYSNDYRIVEKRKSLTNNSRDAGIHFRVMAGAGRLGAYYDFKYTRDNVPALSMGSNNALQYALHEYHFLPIGAASSSAVDALQEEVNDQASSQQFHTLFAGGVFPLRDSLAFDGGAALMFTYTVDRSESRKTKTIDYDPDNNNSSYYNNYDHYYYQALDIYNGAMWGLGPQLKGRVTLHLDKGVTVRALEEVSFLPQFSNEYKITNSDLSLLTTLSGVGVIDDHTLVRETGDRSLYNLTNLCAVGAEMATATAMTLAAGAKWYYTYTYTNVSLTTDDGTAEDENMTHTSAHIHRLILPIGVEYRLHEKYALRLGVTSAFTFTGNTQEAQSSGNNSGSTIQSVNTTSTTFNSQNSTAYAYGFGCHPRDNIQLDITGITDLTNISNLYLSLMLTY